MSQSNNSIFKEIKNEFGQRALKLSREYERKTFKLATYRNHLTFAVKCKVNGVTPKGLRLKCGIRNRKTKEILQKAERQILREHTRQTKGINDSLQKEIERLREELKSIISSSTQVYPIFILWEKCLAKNLLGVIQGLQFAESENYPVCLCRVKTRIFSIVPKQGGLFEHVP